MVESSAALRLPAVVANSMSGTVGKVQSWRSVTETGGELTFLCKFNSLEKKREVAEEREIEVDCGMFPSYKELLSFYALPPPFE